MAYLPKPGKVYRYKRLHFWAQGGQICIEDSRDGSFRCCVPSDFAARVVAINQSLKRVKWQSSACRPWFDEVDEDYRFVENGARCVREARHQGDLTDPKVLEHYMKHHRPNFIYTGPDQCQMVLTQSLFGERSPDCSILPPRPDYKIPTNTGSVIRGRSRHAS